MNILGIDPGSRLAGYGLIQKNGNHHKHLENGTLYLEKIPSYADRLTHLFEQVTQLIQLHNVEALAIENIFYHKNPKSTQKLGEVRGVAIVAASILKVPYFEYTPLEVKKAITGYGKASKHQMQQMVRTLLKLKDIAEENASDALSIALCHAQSSGILNLTAQNQNTKQNRLKDLLKQSSFYK